MFLLAFNLTLFEIIILQLGAIILGVTIYFFWVSNKALSATIRQSKTQLNIAPQKKLWSRKVLKEGALDTLQQNIEDFKINKTKNAPSNPATLPQHEGLNFNTIGSLKDTVLRQQTTLSTLLQKIEGLEEDASRKKELAQEKEELQDKVEKLELQLESKETEVKRLRQQEAVAQQMALRIDEVYKEFDMFQQKIVALEKGAARANALTLELEDTKQSYGQLHKDLIRKQEKLDEMIAENQRLHSALAITEDKLAEANLQRQQLNKKTKFLQEMNDDMQNISESNQKLQNELRRIGELESMLGMIADERDRLLKDNR
jgi:chromosome segregation ATPase